MLRRPCPVSQAPRAETGTPHALQGLQKPAPGQPGIPQGPAHGHPAEAPLALCGQEAKAGSSEAAGAAQDAPAAAAPSQEPEPREPPRMANLVVCPEELIPQWAHEVGLQGTDAHDVGLATDVRLIFMLCSRVVWHQKAPCPVAALTLCRHCSTHCVLPCRLGMYRWGQVSPSGIPLAGWGEACPAEGGGV